MKALWVKKIIWRRYLINDEEIGEVEQIITNLGVMSSEIIEDCYDQNMDVEYDNEEMFIPIEIDVQDIKQTGE